MDRKQTAELLRTNAPQELIAKPRWGHMVGAGLAPAGAAEKGDAMKLAALVLPLFCLAACGSEPEVKMENATVGEVAKEMSKQASNDTFVDPGKWQQTVTLLKI